MFQNANFPGLRPGLLWGAYSAPDTLADGEGLAAPFPRIPAPLYIGPFGLVSTGLTQTQGLTHYRIGNHTNELRFQM